jgi:hypothetical protein
MSPDGSKYPFMPGFGIKDTVDSGSEVDEKPNPSAPKQKNCKVLPQCSFKDFNYVYLFVCQLSLISKNEFVVEGIE